MSNQTIKMQYSWCKKRKENSNLFLFCLILEVISISSGQLGFILALIRQKS